MLQIRGAEIRRSLQPKKKDLSFPKVKEAVKADLILKYCTCNIIHVFRMLDTMLKIVFLFAFA